MSDQVIKSLDDLRRGQRALELTIETLKAFLLIIVGRVTDHTHMTVGEVSRMTGLSEYQVRRHFPMECRPGIRKAQVPVAKVLEGWMSYSVAQAITAREIAQAKAKPRSVRKGNA